MKKAIATISLVLCILVLVSCGASSKIVGTWTHKSDSVLGISLSQTYTFNSDGTGKCNLLGTDINFTYTVKDDVVTIKSTVLGTESSADYTVAFDGNILKMTDASGDTVEYTKQ